MVFLVTSVRDNVGEIFTLSGNIFQTDGPGYMLYIFIYNIYVLYSYTAQGEKSILIFTI